LHKKIIQNKTYTKNTRILRQKKIKANPPPPYSTLNPETSSDSPSAKSKGVQLVSAKQEINQINDKGREKKINHK
jgi:hypothetical protein